MSAGGKLAFVFPGVEPNQDLALDDVAAHFGLGALRASGRERPRAAVPRHPVGPAGSSRRPWTASGWRPDAVAGHSLGEWTGLIVTGMVPDEIVDELSNGLLPDRLAVPDVAT